MSKHDDVTAALNALKATIQAVVDKLNNPPAIPPIEVPVEDTAFLDVVLDGIEEANDALGRALGPIASAPAGSKLNIVGTVTGSGSTSGSPIKAADAVGEPIICPRCNVVYVEGQSHTCNA